MPKHPRARASTRTRSRPAISAPATAAQPAADVQSLTVAELRELPVEVLRLHLNHYNLVTTGNRAAMAKRLHTALHAGHGSHSTAPATSVTDLERTVQSLVDKSLDGLESRLQASLRSLLQQPGASPAPPADPDAAVIVSASPPLACPPTAPPAVPAKVRQRILRGEYIDFDMLLPECLFPARFHTTSAHAFTLRLTPDPANGGDGVVVAQQRPTSKRSVADLSSWLEAWNVYVATLVNHFPRRAASLLAYQRIICQASIHSSPQAWL